MNAKMHAPHARLCTWALPAFWQGQMEGSQPQRQHMSGQQPSPGCSKLGFTPFIPNTAQSLAFPW